MGTTRSGLLVAVATLAAAGCGASGQSASRPKTTAPSTAPTSPTQELKQVQKYAQGAQRYAPADESANAPSIGTVRIGQSQVLQADNEGVPLKIRVIMMRNLAPDQFAVPTSGTHFVGVSLTVTNQGTVTYADSPDNIAQLVLGDNSTLGATIGPSAYMNNGNMTVGSGETRRTWVVFEVPWAKHIKAVEITPDSGFSSTPGEWTVQ